ncbi:MAG: hypothetical protein MUP45_01495, partial [Candidatus Marinimicrobia bacterium]|nr:hypothetical protein [Candidatus Neomarinimicrobiota bacterium]
KGPDFPTGGAIYDRAAVVQAYSTGKGPVINRGIAQIQQSKKEHFQILTHKRLIDILEPTERTIDSLQHLDLPAGVDIEIKM